LTRPALADAFATATGALHRPDPIAARTGGPAGNARLTAWLGLLLLIGFIAEGVTLISVGHLITAHILIGAILIPLVVFKTATTGWRIVRYYQGARDYRTAGPPPIVLRVLGPVVVVTGLAVLGSGLALIALGRDTFSTIVQIAGFQISALTIHKAAFIAWLAATGLHVLARTIPAVQVGFGAGRDGHPIPGDRRRLGTVVIAVLLSVAVGFLVVHLSSDWTHHRIDHHGFRGNDSTAH
jgi:hypothetical protein